MTNEELKQCSEAMIAFTEGKPVQYRRHSENDEVWRGIEKPSWDMTVSLYRPKPTPKRVPWSKPSHFPFGGALRFKGSDVIYFPSNITEEGIEISFKGKPHFCPWATLEEYYKVTTDGVTFKACEVEA